jgi:hypothetical protein
LIEIFDSIINIEKTNMNEDLKNRLFNAQEILLNNSLQNHKKVVDTLYCFSGLALDKLSKKEQNTIEKSMVKINQFLSKYQLETFEDYEKNRFS